MPTVAIPNAEEKPLLSPAEVAEVLGCSAANVYRLIRRGVLSKSPLGGNKSTRVATVELRRVLGLDASTGGQ